MSETVVRGPIRESDDGIHQLPDIDADYSGHLAMGLFVGVIMVLLVVIYAFATAA